MPDIKFGKSLPTDTEKEAVDTAIASLASNHRSNRTSCLCWSTKNTGTSTSPASCPCTLQHTSGWISPGGLNYVVFLRFTPAEAYGVATFYHLFASQPPSSDQVLHNCNDIACSLNGADELLTSLIKEGHETRPSPCLGQCERGPAVFIQKIASEDTVLFNADLPKISELQNENSEKISIELPKWFTSVAASNSNWDC